MTGAQQEGEIRAAQHGCLANPSTCCWLQRDFCEPEAEGKRSDSTRALRGLLLVGSRVLSSRIIVIFVTALTSPFTAAQINDTAPPDVLAVSSYDHAIDLTKQGCSLASCGEPWAGPSPLCVDPMCTKYTVFSVTVRDTSDSAARVSGMQKLTLRLANPRAIEQGVHAISTDDSLVDLSLFQLVSVTIPPGQAPVGDSASGEEINLSARFHGYSLSGMWRLDSIRVSDQAGNVRLLSSTQLTARGLGASMTVSSLQVGQCKGACGSEQGGPGEVSCQLYAAGTTEAWWNCATNVPFSSAPGVCCSTCTAPNDLQPLEVRGFCGGGSAVPSPLCGCYRGNVSAGWSCSFVNTAPPSMDSGALCPGGPSSQCSGIGNVNTCGPHGSAAVGVLATTTPPPVSDVGVRLTTAASAAMSQTTPVPSNQQETRGNATTTSPNNTLSTPAPTPATEDSSQSQLFLGFLAGALPAVFLLFCMVVSRRQWRSLGPICVWIEACKSQIMQPFSTRSPDRFRSPSPVRRTFQIRSLFRNSRNAVNPLPAWQAADVRNQTSAEDAARRGTRQPRASQGSAAAAEDASALRSMGFPLPLALQALAATRMQGVQRATEWILESGLHEEDVHRSSEVHAYIPAGREVHAYAALEAASHSWSSGDGRRFMRRASHGASTDRSVVVGRVMELGDADGVGWGLDSATEGMAHVRVRASHESSAERSRMLAPLTAAEAREYRRNMRMAAARQNSSKRKSLQVLDVPDKNFQGLKDDRLGCECCVCMDERVQARLLPCGHSDLCLKCAAAILQAGQPCPLCRTPVETFVHIAHAQVIKKR